MRPLREIVSSALANRPAAGFAIVFVFALCGGALGGLGIWGLTITPGLFDGPDVVENVAASFGILFPFVVFGFVVGLPFAAFAGVIYAALPRSLQRIVLAPLVGAVATATLQGLGLSFLGSAAGGGLIFLSVVGALAATVCALLVRALGLDLRGAERAPPRARAEAASAH